MRSNNIPLLTLVLFFSIFFMSIRPVADADFWWHLKTGEYIYATGSIPKTDPFSYTKNGEPWIAHEWLSEFILYSLYQVGNYYLLIPFFSVIITLSFFLVYLSSPNHSFLTSFMVLLSALASAPTWGVRPQMFTILFSSLFILLLEYYQRKRKLRYLAILPIFMVIWVNLHAGYIIGLVIICIFIFSEFVCLITSTKETIHRRDIIFYCCALLLCMIAALLNPNGYKILIYPFLTLFSSSMMQLIQEWFSPDFHQTEWVPLVILFLALIAIPSITRKPGKLISLILVLVFSYLSLRSMRFVPMLSLVAIPFISERTRTFIPIVPKHAQKSNLKNILNIFLLVLVFILGALYSVLVISNQNKSEEQNFPKKAVDWIVTNNPEGNILNTYGWGGYLIWRLNPAYPVYIDGRADLYGDEFMYSYLNTYTGQAGWEDTIDHSNVKIILIEPESGLSAQLMESSTWHAVYKDDISIIFVRK